MLGSTSPLRLFTLIAGTAATLTTLAAALPPGWSERLAEGAPQGARIGSVLFSAQRADLAARPSLIVGVRNPSTGFVTLREVDFTNGGMLPQFDANVTTLPANVREGRVSGNVATAMYRGDLDGDGASDDEELFVWNMRRGADGSLAASDQVTTTLRVRDCAPGAAYAIIPTQAGSFTGVILYSPAAPADPTNTPMIVQRFAISPTGVTTVGNPVTVATAVDITQSMSNVLAVSMVRKDNGQVIVCGTTTHFLTVQGSGQCGSGSQSVVTTVATARIGGGQLTPVSRLNVSSCVRATAPAQRNSLSTSIAMQQTRATILLHSLGSVADGGEVPLSGWQYNITLSDTGSIVSTESRPPLEIAGIHNNPLFQSNGTSGHNPIHKSSINGQDVYELTIPGLLTSSGGRLMGVFRFPSNITQPSTYDVAMWREPPRTDCLATVAIGDLGTNGEAGSRMIAVGIPLADGVNGLEAGGLALPDDIFGTPPCPADVNLDGGIDGGDVEFFFEAWVNALPLGDFNSDGGIDGSDVDAFFARWSAGC